MPNQIENILAEYMEKFGKKLNEHESRTGDELFMWLKKKFTQLQTEERQKFLQFIKADGEMIYDGKGNIVKFDESELKFKDGKFSKKE